jgi:lipoprotein-releasing system permease protein
LNFALYIAKRYLKSKSSNNAINFITYIALIGVILGAASLFIVLSGFSGLRDFTLKFTSVIDPDFKVESATGKSFVLTETLQNDLKQIDNIKLYAKVIEERVIATSEGKQVMAFIKGVDENYQNITQTDSILYNGSWLDQDTPQIVSGYGIASALSIGVLDYGKAINIYVPKPGKGQITKKEQAFNTFSAINVGVYSLNEALDNKYIFASFDTAKILLDYKDHQISSLEIQLKNPELLDETRQQLEQILGKSFKIKDTSQLNDALYKMLNTENLAVYLIFTLVLIIALFNVIGSIVMMILDKRQTLSTLYNMGSTIAQIRNIFFMQGVLMSVVGGFLGLVIGYIIVQLQYSFSLVMLTPNLPYPVAIKFMNFVVVFITITVLGVIASKIASSRISKTLLQKS